MPNWRVFYVTASSIFERTFSSPFFGATTMIKILRAQNKISQEDLAESAGLSLRTIQRAEAGYRVSYRSLRALAKALHVDVDELEWELYAMNKQSDEFIEAPLWIRLFLQKSWTNLNRGIAQKLEILGICLFVVLWIAYLLPLFDDVIVGNRNTSLDFYVLAIGVEALFWAYVMCLYIRLGDKYASWRQWE
ncbi:MAG: helix-turn-helix transcriptional regulator [Pseudomonadales bacterium]|nr:helix-turn-helix transcriptional regulator [Pseudomonadales bacterium]